MQLSNNAGLNVWKVNKVWSACKYISTAGAANMACCDGNKFNADNTSPENCSKKLLFVFDNVLFEDLSPFIIAMNNNKQYTYLIRSHQIAKVLISIFYIRYFSRRCLKSCTFSIYKYIERLFNVKNFNVFFL